MITKVQEIPSVYKRIIWIATLLWMIMIFIFSSQPSSASLDASGKVLVKMGEMEEGEVHNIEDRRIWNLHYHIRKLAHFVIYAVLGGLIFLSITVAKGLSFKMAGVSWLAASFYGVMDEIHQTFVPGRGATFADMRLDSMSAMAGIIVTYAFVKLIFRCRRNGEIV